MRRHSLSVRLIGALLATLAVFGMIAGVAAGAAAYPAASGAAVPRDQAISSAVAEAGTGRGIRGFVFVGTGGNDANKRGLGGVLVTLDGMGLHVTATTSSNGGFEFSDLPAGTFAVTITPPGGYQLTTASTQSVVVSDATVIDVQTGKARIVPQVVQVGNSVLMAAPSPPGPSPTGTPLPAAMGNSSIVSAVAGITTSAGTGNLSAATAANVLPLRLPSTGTGGILPAR